MQGARVRYAPSRPAVDRPLDCPLPLSVFIIVLCPARRCSAKAKYGLFEPGAPRNRVIAIFCKEHQEPGMVMQSSDKTCEYPGCGAIARFNTPNQAPSTRFCTKHQLPGMVNMKVRNSSAKKLSKPLS